MSDHSYYDLPGQQSSSKPPGQKPPPCEDDGCDLGAIDDLECENIGLKERSAKAEEFGKDLTRRRTDFDGARAAYTAARREASATVKDLRHRLTAAKEQLECRLTTDEVYCLVDAYAAVTACLVDCGGTGGCCFEDDCEFDDDCANTTDALHAKIAEILRRVTAAETCFDRLILEPTELATRVAAVKTATEAIEAELKADPKTTDLRMTYAKTLVAWALVVEVWAGFADANAYYECICNALTCSLKGRKLLATLYGKVKELECQDAAKVARCKRLRDNMVEEIMTKALKCLATHHSGGDHEQKQSAATATVE
jgi:hypothetical protein